MRINRSADVCVEEYKRNNEHKERFADYLIRKGVLSTKMLQELKNELLNKDDSTSSHSSSDKDSKIRHSNPMGRKKKRK